MLLERAAANAVLGERCSPQPDGGSCHVDDGLAACDHLPASAEAVPMTVVSVATQARRVGSGASDEVATARLPARSGGWLRLDASQLEDDDRVAVMISSGAEPGLADLIARAHGLSSREREVTTLTLQGLSTREMAASLSVSPYTVQDHLKSIFDKVGVRSRRELAAQLFVMDVVPRMAVLEEEQIPA